MFCCIVSCGSSSIERRVASRRLALVASHPANINKAKLRAQLMSCQAGAHRSSRSRSARQTFVQFGDDLCSSCSRGRDDEQEQEQDEEDDCG